MELTLHNNHSKRDCRLTSCQQAVDRERGFLSFYSRTLRTVNHQVSLVTSLSSLRRWPQPRLRLAWQCAADRLAQFLSLVAQRCARLINLSQQADQLWGNGE
jgi:hypothetical protein